MQVQGNCHCGRITYEAEVDPAKVSLCNCTDCQMLTGSAYRVAVPAPRADFKLLSGEPKSYIKIAESGNRRLHAFCADCGAPVYSCAPTEPQFYSLRVGCLKQRHALPPKKQIWCRSALAWAQDIREVPKSDRQD